MQTNSVKWGVQDFLLRPKKSLKVSRSGKKGQMLLISSSFNIPVGLFLLRHSLNAVLYKSLNQWTVPGLFLKCR